MEQGTTKEAVIEMYRVLEWFYEMIDEANEE